MATTTTQTSATAGSRTIVGLMGMAVLFSLVGHEIKTANAPPITSVPTPSGPEGKVGGGAITPAPSGGIVSAVSTGGRIVVGGTFATALLVALSHAGNPGREWAVGLSVLAVLTATLVYGGPVWSGASKLFGSKPTTGTATTTPGTNALNSSAVIATNVVA